MLLESSKSHLDIDFNYSNAESYPYLNKLRYILTPIFFVLFCTIVYSNVIFHNINDIHGISIRETTSAIMDDHGFVWVSSKMGVLRLTEDDYHFYNLPYATSDVINVKLIYHNCTLYAYSNNGQVFRYNAVLDQFDFYVNLAVHLDLPFLSISNLVIDEEGVFWIAAIDGLIIFSNEETVLIDDLGEIQNIEWYNEDKLIVSAIDEFVLFSKSKQTIVHYFQESLNLPSRVSKLYFDNEQSTLLVGTEFSGLYVYDFSTEESFRIESIPRQPILAIEQVTDSTYLVGIDGQGAWELNRRNYLVSNVFKENLDIHNSLRGNGVYDIYRDRTGRVWICTYSGGVSYYDYSPRYLSRIEYIINEPNSIVNNDVNDIIEDSRGNLWFATNNGLSRWDVTRNLWTSFYHNDDQQVQVFLSLCEDADGNIWAGTYSAGVFVLDGITGGEIAQYNSESKDVEFNNNFIFDIYKDSKNNLWIVGVRGDIICYDSSTGEFISYLAQPVYVIKEYSDNVMLLGCSYGLSMLNIETGHIDIILSGYLIHDFSISGSTIWLSTVGEGLVKYNMTTGEQLRFSETSGLPSNFINSIIADGDYFWLGTETGLCKFHSVNYTVETYPEIESFSGVSYNRTARLQLLSGSLVFGTNRGAVIFDPKQIASEVPDGKIFFQELRVMGKSFRNDITIPLDSLKHIELNHNQGALSLDLVPLGMTSGAKFSWLLEGVDSDWSLPIGSRTLNYSNVPTGKFTLRIRMYDNSMLNMVNERMLYIVKKPPFWETWWFLLVVSLVLLGVFYISLKYYINLIKQLHSEEKIRFFANTAHDIRTSLTLIKAPIDELDSETALSDIGRYYLNLAKEQVNRLTTVVTQLMDFQKADVGKEQLSLKKVDLVKLISHRLLMFESVANEKDIEIRFKDNSEFHFAYVDELMIEKVVDNLVSNAIKYSNSGGVVDVKFTTGECKWYLEIQDYGIGISKNAQRQLFKEFYRGENAINSKVVGSGIGLILIKKYIELHGGNIECESQISQGTTFKVVVPEKEGIPQNDMLSADIELFDMEDGVSATEELERSNLPTVLIVEDNEDLREFLNLSLRAEFKIVMAADGDQAWTIVQDTLPDLIVSDVMMPVMDGFELCNLVKSTYETSHIPFVMLTALTDQGKHLKGLGLGADDYLTKPFNTNLLRQRIKSIIQNRSAVHDKALKIIKGVDNEPLLSNELNDQFVKKALTVIQENITNPLFNKDLFASEMNVSGSLLYKKIKSLTDLSPTDLIKSIRLTKSLELLQSRKYSITEVGELCGFSSVGYFSTVFKKHYGKTPSEVIEA